MAQVGADNYNLGELDADVNALAGTVNVNPADTGIVYCHNVLGDFTLNATTLYASVFYVLVDNSDASDHNINYGTNINSGFDLIGLGTKVLIQFVNINGVYYPIDHGAY